MVDLTERDLVGMSGGQGTAGLCEYWVLVVKDMHQTTAGWGAMRVLIGLDMG